MHIILTLPTAEIQADALLRDRITLDDAALEDLAASIATDGLRGGVEQRRRIRKQRGERMGEAWPVRLAPGLRGKRIGGSENQRR